MWSTKELAKLVEYIGCKSCRLYPIGCSFERIIECMEAKIALEKEE